MRLGKAGRTLFYRAYEESAARRIREALAAEAAAMAAVVAGRMNERRTRLVAYDIRASARLVKVHRAMTRRGHALEYSLFAADFTLEERDGAIAVLAALIDPRADDIRFYRVPTNPFGAWQGRMLAPQNLLLVMEPAAVLPGRLARRPFLAQPE